MPGYPDYRPAAGTVPNEPGVYRFLADGRPIYVGKAKNLRARLASYFGPFADLHPRTQAMVTAATGIEWTVVASEIEALQLEYTWIKEFSPRFNVKYRDDKSYPLLAVTVGDEVPRAFVYRGERRKGVRYFGPYSHAWAIRDSLDLLLRPFPIRTCSPGVFRRAAASGRACLLADIGKCSAPCVGRIDAAEHRELVDQFCDFLAGQTDRYLRRLTEQMKEAAAAQDYERAARLRDDLAALRTAMERNTVVLTDDTDADVIGMADDELQAAVHLFHVRGGRIRGERGFIVDRVEVLDEGGLVEHLLGELYSPTDPAPPLILVPHSPAEAASVQRWLSAEAGRQVELRVPRRGDKRTLLQTASRNAEQSLLLHKLRRAGDLTTRSQALTELAEALGLPAAPLRIEAIDVSTLQGDHTVASLVVFEDGAPRKQDYRRFVIREATDDVGSVREVVRRRFAADSAAEPKRSAYPPQLLVIDGGAPQVTAARAELAALGREIPVIGLAKRLEEVWLPDDPDPLLLPRTGEGLFLLQRVRDEAHRFAVSFHRVRRRAGMVESLLDDVPGLGPTRRAALLRHFGSVKRLRAASVEEVAGVPGIGRVTAAAVVARLAAEPAAPTVDPATGEIRSESGRTS
jgi:excinuclease ABC subunit C